MDFLERWLGFSLDNGSGWSEAILLGALLLALAAVARRRSRHTV